MMAALKRRTVRRSSTRPQSTTVFILTQAIYSIRAIPLVLLFFRVFVDYSLQIKQKEIHSVFELKYNDPFVSCTHLPDWLVPPGYRISKQVNVCML